MTRALVAPQPAGALGAAPTTVDAATRRRRWLHLGRAVAGGLVRTAPLPAGPRRRQRLLVRSAADLLCAVGVRVEVCAPPAAWPRGGPGRLVVGNRTCWLDDLALLTAVPGARVVDARSTGRWLRRCGDVALDGARARTLPRAVAEVSARLRGGATVVCSPGEPTAERGGLGRFRPPLLQAAVDSGAPVCPVAVVHRTGARRPTSDLAGVGSPWRALRRAVATRDLVIEVHLLPALDPAGTDRRTLAALAEYSVAAVTEAGRQSPPRAPDRVSARLCTATVDRPRPEEDPCSASSACCSSSGWR